jgi:hypothetical protein
VTFLWITDAAVVFAPRLASTPGLSAHPGSSAAWLARSVRDAEVAGSNPAFPTTSWQQKSLVGDDKSRRNNDPTMLQQCEVTERAR